ncbi:hypothetical protein [Flavobacterium psychrotolerans]|uniref:EF-hand domain-containing protein n=1 Tax=Flavobacterium psychrotolerans TaxID=2169410 RepID=A0A2U1JJV0_9FLAO|nr:hypothetical protein [Flavobacterium psychrotolerans]PWA05421.1 hypothetical protein DB895_07440 [Flavobacterium psychrotolerans]
MKNIAKYSVVFFLALLVSCKEEIENPKVIYENSSKPKEQPKLDTDQVEIADLPIQMQGTNYLIHPVGGLNIYGGNAKLKYDSSSNVNDISFKISNYSEYEITGYLQNLKFQEIGSDSIKALTDKPILIQTATYLKSVSDKTKQQVLVYALADMDTNKDDKLDVNDIKTLYISEISGKRFTKISADLQELIDWNLMESKSRLYFRTIEDTNKNGQFDKDDVVHYHYLDLSNKDWKVMDYNPI